MRKIYGIVAALLLSGPALAASPPAAQTMSLEQRLLVLERKVQALGELSFRLDALQREVQQLRGEVEVQAHTLEGIKQRQRTLYLDIDQRLSQLRAGPAPSTNPSTGAQQANLPATGTAAPPSGESAPAANELVTIDPAQEEAAYQRAFDILMQRRYDEARRELQQFLQRYPGGRYADNAQYWLAEASYVVRDFDTALAEFGKVIDLHPQSAKVPDALLKRGFILYEQKSWSEARASLERVLKEFPGSSASRLARQRLDKMQAEGR